ncbi:MAG: phosphopantetheine-binding protein, partial [Tepidisphaeraceae bacterium]
MLNRIIIRLILCLLALRYRIRVRGLARILARGNTGILFLPNHVARIDPVILVVLLFAKFAPRPLADRRQVDRFFIRWVARRIGVRTLPDVNKDGLGSTEQIQQMLAGTIEGLKRGENALMYPAGHVTYTRLEDLGGNSAAEQLIRGAPGARVILVRTRGLWGSSFSRANSREVDVQRILRKGLLSLLANGLFFGPRRQVDIELYEPADLPRPADRSTLVPPVPSPAESGRTHTTPDTASEGTGGTVSPALALNRYLERFYNENTLPNTYVPFTIWESGGTRELPEPKADFARPEDLANVPAATRQLVLDHLREVSGIAANDLRHDARLANDLGLDSLARAELLVWLEKEFGFPQSGPDSLQTVGEVLLAACGASVSIHGDAVKPPPAVWFAERGNPKLLIPDGDTITTVFLRQAARSPSRAAVADQTA